MTHKWRTAALLGVWVAGACSGEESTAPRPACTGPVTVAATREARPLFTWTPDCAVARLWVGAAPVLGQGQEVLWDIRGGAAGIVSGVRYGAVPRGATEEVPAGYVSFSQLYVTVFGADGARLGGVPILFP